MGVAERNFRMGFYQKSEIKKDEKEDSDKRLLEYEALKAEFEAEVKEYNESADALQAWANELQERKAILDKMQEQL